MLHKLFQSIENKNEKCPNFFYEANIILILNAAKYTVKL